MEYLHIYYTCISMRETYSIYEVHALVKLYKTRYHNNNYKST